MITDDYLPKPKPVRRKLLVHVKAAGVGNWDALVGVTGEKPVTPGPGQTFYESRNSIDTIDRNQNKTTPVKFLVLLIKDKDGPISIPVEYFRYQPRTSHVGGVFAKQTGRTSSQDSGVQND